MLPKATPDRLSAFSDAVFAVLITVLVLELRPPEQPTFESLLLLWPTWLSYAVSYVFIAIVWVSVLSTERGLHLTFSSGDTEESIELSPKAVEQTSKTLHDVTRDPGEGPLTLTVLGHRVVRTHEAYGLLLRTQEFGDVVFSLPHVILKRLIGDLMQLASSPPASQTFGSGYATGHARRDMGERRS